MTPTETVEPAVLIDEVLSPSCDMGGIIYKPTSPDERCDRPAEWTAMIHDCHLGAPILMCTPHLAQARTDPSPNQLTSWTCKSCGLIAVSIDEAIWNIRRLGVTL